MYLLKTEQEIDEPVPPGKTANVVALDNIYRGSGDGKKTIARFEVTLSMKGRYLIKGPFRDDWDPGGVILIEWK